MGLYTVRQTLRWDEFNWNVTQFKFGWPLMIWMTSYQIHFDIAIFQPSKEKIEVHRDKVEWKNLKPQPENL